jgi:hypothetical protein
MRREPVECSTHGAAFPTYVCKHIGGAAARAGFVFDRQSSEPWPDAVCDSGTWLWGWANSHWQASVTEAIVRVKRRGEAEGVRSLTRSQFIATETVAWSLASAVLDTLPEVLGVYRAPGETGSLFLAVTGARFTS